MHAPNQRGMALPVTLFIITLMTIMLAAAFARVGAERETAVGASDAIRALTVAQSGLQAYLGSRTSRPPDGDSVRINVTGGYADVVARIVQRPADPRQKETYIVRSTGYVIVPALGATAQGKRTVAQFAQWQLGVIRQFAAFTVANSLDDRTPYRIAIDGTDFCGDSAPAWAVRTQTSGSYTHGAGEGTYLGRPLTVIESGTGKTVADTSGMDWSMIVNGTFVPDYTSLVTGDSLYKSQVIQGNATLNDASGTGLLAVTGNLTTSGVLARWEGIVLVGGEILFNADSTAFLGMVISGLDDQTGSAPNARIGNKPVYIRYDSCRVRQTLTGFTGFAPIRNAWVDNWASY